jgi:hypothetical protein
MARQIVHGATIVHDTISSHTLLTLLSRSVSCLVNTYNVIKKPNLVHQTWERRVISDLTCHLSP